MPSERRSPIHSRWTISTGSINEEPQDIRSPTRRPEHHAQARGDVADRVGREIAEVGVGHDEDAEESRGRTMKISILKPAKLSDRMAAMIASINVIGSRQRQRRALFDLHFRRLPINAIGTVDNPISSRPERRKLARAKAAGQWRGMKLETRGRR